MLLKYKKLNGAFLAFSAAQKIDQCFIKNDI